MSIRIPDPCARRLQGVWRPLSIFAAVGILICSTTTGKAAGGMLDSTFGTGGKVTTAVGSFGGYGYCVAIQADGKIIVGGSTGSASSDFALARYNSDGSLDLTFDTDGKVTTDFGGIDLARGIALQPDGKIVLAGETGPFQGPPTFAVARYNSNGSLDTSFDTDGKLTTSFGSESAVYAVAIQSDLKILVAGRASTGMINGFGLARYNIDGSLDTSFDGDGKLITPNSGAVKALVLQSNKIIAAGYAGIFDSDFALARYNANGSLDTSFDLDGVLLTDFSGGDDDGAASVALQADRKILAAGYAVAQTGDSAIARYNSDGSLDSTFDGDGKLVFDMGFGDQALGVAVQPDGKVFTTFGANDERAHAVTLQPDGKIVAAGYFQSSNSSGFALARYIASSKNAAFDFDGDLKTDLSIFRPGPGEWWWNRSSNGGNSAVQFGTSSDRIAAAHYTGDGKTDVAFFRPSTGGWFVLRSEDFSFYSFPFGTNGDTPVPGDYDGDGRNDAAVFRPSTSTWFAQRATGGTLIQQFGIAGDIPLPSAFVR